MRHSELYDELAIDEPDTLSLIQEAITWGQCSGSVGSSLNDAGRGGRTSVSRVAKHPAAWRVDAAPWHHAVGMVFIRPGNPGQYHHYGRDETP